MQNDKLIFPPKTQDDAIDCVKMMRDIRNKLDIKLQHLTLQEEQDFLEKLIKRKIKL